MSKRKASQMRFCEGGTPDIGKMEYLDIYEKNNRRQKSE